MSWGEALLLAVVEGLTEFLPVSSTGHLILVSSFLGRASEEGVQAYEIVIQGGAILAVVFHSWRRLWQPRLYLLVGAAFLPTALIGFLAADRVERLLDAPGVVAVNLILGGLVLMGMDRWFAHRQGRIESLSWVQAMLIGVVQAFSLFPGVSRAAAALFGAQLMGLSRREAAEFSFLLAVPTLGAASLYKLWKTPSLLAGPDASLLGLGVVVAFAVALVAMRFLVSLWSRYGMLPFGIYRIVLGTLVLVWLGRSWQ
uniref:Undecaprenyl-diphosphatase n=1 Tax=uncultured Bacteroidota bacterium TaxID=152509 RepID=H5SMS3_9BACT|nr:undecaprenyl-diphosphatase [uncultured Bacteroidetes bacterium]